MVVRCRFAFALALAPLVMATTAAAQSSGGPAVVVAQRGHRSAEAHLLGRRVRRRLANAVGRLKSSRQWQTQVRTLGGGPRAGTMAAAARSMGAAYVLDLKTFRQNGQLFLLARMIRARDDRILLLRRRLPYGRAENARRLAQHVVQMSLITLQREGFDVGGAAPALTEPPAASLPPPSPPPPSPPPPSPPLPSAPPPSPPAPPSDAIGPDLSVPAEAPSVPGAGDGADDSTPSSPAEAPSVPGAGDGADDSTPSSPAEAVPATPRPDQDAPPAPVVELTLGGGIGAYRNYRLSGPAGPSAVSHRATAVPYFAGAFRFTASTVPVGVHARVGFRTIQYTVGGFTRGPVSVQGQLLDVDAGLHYRFGGRTWSVCPRLGVRATIATVEDVPDAALLDATTVAPTVGFDATVGGRWWDVRAGGDFGWIVAYDEAPTRSGQNGRGPMAGARLGSTVWFTERFGIGVDGELVIDDLRFDGAPDRFLPPPERGQITDARLTIVDVRVAGGARLRF